MGEIKGGGGRETARGSDGSTVVVVNVPTPSGDMKVTQTTNGYGQETSHTTVHPDGTVNTHKSS